MKEIEKIDEFLKYCKLQSEDLIEEFYYEKTRKKVSKTPFLKFKNDNKISDIEISLKKCFNKIEIGKRIKKKLYYLKFFFEEILKDQYYKVKNNPVLQYYTYELKINFPDQFVIGFYYTYKGKPGPVLWVNNPREFSLKKLFDSLKSNNIHDPFEKPKCRAIILHKHTHMYVLTNEFLLQSRIVRKKFKDVNNRIFCYVKK